MKTWIPLSLCLTLGACETTVVNRSGDLVPGRPEPRRLPDPPASARANAMAVRVAARPLDTNGNGFPDLIPVQVYLFTLPHAAPIHEPGSFVFRLYQDGLAISPTTPTLVSWRIEGEALEEAKMRDRMFGRGYGFGLSLLDIGSDEFPLMATNLTCQFESADGGEPVTNSETYTIQIGRRMSARGNGGAN